ncbi:MAG: hypothetical protein PVJ52_03065 [Candidatus Woesebacteria bacterium]|jgi:hypothetical protein
MGTVNNKEAIPWCGSDQGKSIPCKGKLTGECEMAEQIKHQSEHGRKGGWERQVWEGFIKRQEKFLEICEHPDQLQEALKIEPKYID